jgi:hypothetical protein
MKLYLNNDIWQPVKGRTVLLKTMPITDNAEVRAAFESVIKLLTFFRERKRQFLEIFH